MSAPVSTRKVKPVVLSVTWSCGDTSRPSLMAPIDGGPTRFPVWLLFVHCKVVCICVFDCRIFDDSNTDLYLVCGVACIA